MSAITETHNEVEDADELLQKEMDAIKTGCENAPENYSAAVRRIMELEMRLEDLCRSVEIAEITRQLELVEGFRRLGDEALATKMVFKREHTGDINLTVITGELDPAIVNNAKV